MGANWAKFEGMLKEATTLVLSGNEILDGEWDGVGKARVTPKGSVSPVFVNLHTLGQPLGKYWTTLYQKQEFSLLRDALKKYWSHVGIPNLSVDVVGGRLETDERDDRLVVRSKVVNPGAKPDDRLGRIVDSMRKQEFGVDRVVVGTQDDHVELQFLSKRLRQEVKQGDMVDCGLFVSLNGQVQVSAGLNRLVCTNGLIRRMDVWKQEDFNFSPEYIEQAQRLMTWFKGTTGQKIHNVRDISVVLDLFPKTFVNRFWKRWSEGIELGELTWFQVIDDLTHAVNGTLGELRYRTLAVPERIQGYGGRCHACSASIGEEDGN